MTCTTSGHHHTMSKSRVIVKINIKNQQLGPLNNPNIHHVQHIKETKSEVLLKHEKIVQVLEFSIFNFYF